MHTAMDTDMITEVGQVLSVSGDQAWVQVIRQSACQSCSARHGCGQKALATLSGGQSRQVRVVNRLGARPGDQVTLAIEPASLLRASLLVYALPLVMMVMVAGLAGVAGLGEGAAILAAMGGLAGGLFMARLVSRGSKAHYQPRMVACESSSSITDQSLNPTVF